jgi:hypothetical protein
MPSRPKHSRNNGCCHSRVRFGQGRINRIFTNLVRISPIRKAPPAHINRLLTLAAPSCGRCRSQIRDAQLRSIRVRDAFASRVTNIEQTLDNSGRRNRKVRVSNREFMTKRGLSHLRQNFLTGRLTPSKRGAARFLRTCWELGSEHAPSPRSRKPFLNCRNALTVACADTRPLVTRHSCIANTARPYGSCRVEIHAGASGYRKMRDVVNDSDWR